MTAPPTQHEKVIEQWRHHLEGIAAELREARLQRTVWEEFRDEVIARRPDCDGTFLYVFSQQYASTQLSRVRRLTERSGSALSLVNLIDAIQRNPLVWTRTRYLAMYGEDAHHAPSRWDEAWFDGEAIRTQALTSDIERLESQTKHLKTWVDKKIAHLDRSHPERTPRFREVDEALTLLESTTSRYSELLTGSTWAWELLATGDWTAIFRPVLFPLDPSTWDWHAPGGFT